MESICIYKIVAGIGYFSMAAMASPMQLVSDERGISLDVGYSWFDQGQFNTVNESDLVVPMGAFSAVNEETIITHQAGYLGASQLSEVSELQISGQGQILGSTESEDGIAYEMFETAGISSVAVEFSISEQTAFFLDALLYSSGSPGESGVWLRGINGTAFYFHDSTNLYDSENTSVDVEQGFVLDAGSYVFEMSSSLFSSDADYGAMASFQGSLSVVPAPSAIGLLVVSGLVATRRRR